MSTLEWIAYYFDLLPIAVFLFFLVTKKKLATPLWVILLYCSYSFANSSKNIYNFRHGLESSLLFYIFTLIEYILFALFIYAVLEKTLYRRMLIFCSVLFTLFCLFNIFFRDKSWFDSQQSGIESLLLLIFCILFLFEQINKPELVFIYASYKFWIVTGILIYLATSFFLYVFALSLPPDQINQYWVINHVSSILRNLFFAIAIIVYAKSPKRPLPPKSLESDYKPFLS